MRRLLALAALSAAAITAVPTVAYAGCGGHVDTTCTGTVCPSDCWQRSCAVWIDARHSSTTAVCVETLQPLNG